MLLGSRSGFAPPLVDEPETPLPEAPLVAAPDCDAVADLSSTGAALSSVGVVWQPARATAISVAKKRLRIQPPTLLRPGTKCEWGATGARRPEFPPEPLSLPRARPPGGPGCVRGRRG